MCGTRHTQKNKIKCVGAKPYPQVILEKMYVGCDMLLRCAVRKLALSCWLAAEDLDELFDLPTLFGSYRRAHKHGAKRWWDVGQVEMISAHTWARQK